MISVVIPVYNVEPYLERCLDSVVGQTFRDIEVIVVDDGSTDSCGEICDIYAHKDKRIHVIHKENGGESSARNEALKYVNGDWISFVDSDDWLELDAYERLLKIDNVDKYDMVSFALYREFNHKGKAINPYPSEQSITDKGIIKKIQLACLEKEYNPISRKWGSFYLWDKIIRTDIIRDSHLKFRTSLKAQEDVFFMFELYSYINSIYYYNHPLYHYKYNPESQTQRFTPNRVEIDRHFYREIRNASKNMDLDKEFENALRARIVMNTYASGYRSFFHKKNPKSFLQKYDDMRKTLKIKEIEDAFLNADRLHLSDMGRFITCSKLFRAPLVTTACFYTIVRDYFLNKK